MARPTKEGLDYFPLDVDIDQDDKVIIIIAKYGMQGFGILVKLLMAIYKNGYSYKWSEKEQIIFSSRVNVDINLINDVVNDCIKWGLFNENIYNEYGVLTSKGIQERYLLAASRRVNIVINENIKLVSVNINTDLTEKLQAKSTQSKRKEIKPKDTKSKDTNNTIIVDIIDYLNHQADKKYKHSTDKTKKLIQTRLNDGFTLDDFKKVIDNKVKVWKGNPEMDSYLRPETLFGTKFEGYLNEKPINTSYSQPGQARTGQGKKSLFAQGEESRKRQEEAEKEMEGKVIDWEKELEDMPF